MKKLFLIITWGMITSNIFNMKSEYTITEWPVANDLKAKPGTEFVMNIEYNNGVVYYLTDGNYVVMPVNPFAKCLVTKSKELLEKWILDGYFPTNESANTFYFSNKKKIDDIKASEKMLIEELSIYFGKDLHNLNDPSEIDNVHSILKKKKTWTKFKLNFIVFIGNYISNKYSADNISWGKIKIKQLLNPITEIVLTKVISQDHRYFNIQDKVLGKWGYRGIKDIEVSYSRNWLRPDEFCTIEE